MMVKYEDIVTKPLEMASKLYGFLNKTADLEYARGFFESRIEAAADPKKSLASSLSKQALRMSLTQRKIRFEAKWRHGEISKAEYDKAIQNASYVPQPNPDEERENRLHKYYGTFRPINFRHDHWKTELKPEVLKEILMHDDCREVMKLLSYDL